MIFNAAKRWFSNLKIPIDSIKKLREETSAPMGECKKALQESECSHELALQWLKQKGLASAEKRAQKETRQGVIASFVTPCRRKALMLQINCQTDFVAKSQLFLKFVKGVGQRLLQQEQSVAIQGPQADQVKLSINQILQKTQPANIFPEDSSAKNLNEEMKLVISRLQQNIIISRALTLNSDYSRYGTYVHRPYTDSIGLQACVVEVSTDPQPAEQEAEEIINQFADDIATQILGAPPKYLNFQQIPQDQILTQTEKVRAVIGDVLAKAPQYTHDKIISGKLHSTFYSQVLLGCMPYLLSNEGAQVSEYWTTAEKNSGSNISIVKAVTWECK